jgi:dihydroneopterin aldolase / 2-amino-4-hydroxy-6-hydroxymethyldihydropteridine diphosphokinase
MTVRIELRGVAARGRHGVLAAERELGQLFVVDAVLEVDTAAAAATDDLTKTADYGEVATRLVAVIAGEPVDLLETLVERLLDACLQDPAVEAATVTVHKPAAPVPVPFSDVAVTAQRSRVGVLSIGSNLGDRLANLQAAVDIARLQGLIAVSGVYETDPVGGPEQEDYLNAVLLVRGGSPQRLLELCRAAESVRDRVRDIRWGPRTLDVDVIAAGLTVLDTPELTVPHPRAHERAFVLLPWLEVDPAASIPQHGPVAQLLTGLETSGVRPRPDLTLR